MLLFFLLLPSLRLGSPGTPECAFRLGSRRDCAYARARECFVQFEFTRPFASFRHVSPLMPFPLSALLWMDFPGFADANVHMENQMMWCLRMQGDAKQTVHLFLYKCCCVQSNKSLALPYISKQISFTVSYKARRVWGPILPLRRRETISKPPVLLFIKCKRAAIYCILTCDKF